MRRTFIVKKLSDVPDWPAGLIFPTSYESKKEPHFSPKGYYTKAAFEEIGRPGGINTFVQSVSVNQCNPVESPF